MLTRYQVHVPLLWSSMAKPLESEAHRCSADLADAICSTLESSVAAPTLAPLSLPMPASNNFTGTESCALLLDGVLSAITCQSLIALTEEYYDWPDQCVDRSGVRRARRCIVDSAVAAGTLFARLKSALPAELPVPGHTTRKWKLVGLNSRLRFLKYSANDYFAPHCDGPYVEHSDRRSFLTLMLYLDGNAVGGEVRGVLCALSGLRLMLTNVRTGAGALPRSNRPGLKSNRSHGRSRPRANLFA